MRTTQTLMNKPVYLKLSILDISKTVTVVLLWNTKIW